MIIKGKSRAGPVALALHLGNAETNEKISLFELRGVVANDLRGALVEMNAVAAGTRCQKPLYHAAISPEPPKKLTDRQIDIAVNTLEVELGFSGHARAIVIHEKLGREHIHVVWSRIELENMRSVSDSYNYRKHEKVARELERQFDHERVQGAHAERDGVNRPDRTPSRAELRQQERTGIRISDVKRDLTDAFQRSDSAPSFVAAVEDMGYIVAQGDRRDFVIIDQSGGVHSVARRIEGVRANELREFMASIDRASMPTVEHATAAQHDRDARAIYRDYVEKYVQPDTQHRRPLGADSSSALERGYSKGGDYVSQSSEALKHHQERQERLNSERQEEASRRNAEQAAKRDTGRSGSFGTSKSSSDSGPDDAINDAFASFDRRDEQSAKKLKPDRGANRQREAPGGGRSRGR